jgi:uncharacterized membrane protein YdcZ (DUF606 family)
MRRLGNLATPWWMGGVALAAAGVIAARVAAPALGGAAQSTVAIAGQLLALGGLAVIAVGVSRRVHRDSSP